MCATIGSTFSDTVVVFLDQGSLGLNAKDLKDNEGK